jgi:hypothetical protein
MNARAYSRNARAYSRGTIIAMAGPIIVTAGPIIVMAGLDPAIHVFAAAFAGHPGKGRH